MKFYGIVGYSKTVDKGFGVWEDCIEERNYYGDVIKHGSSWKAGEGINDDLAITNQISILADPYAYMNFSRIKYVMWMGVKWKVTQINVERPRLTLTLGGEYNG